MKKLNILLTLVFCAIIWQAESQNETFRVQFTALDATCYNNGKVVYALVDSNGQILGTLPEGITNVRIYYKPAETDSIQYAGWYYTGGSDTLNLNHGTYTIGVEALKSDGINGFVRVDTHTVITVNTTYQRPTASVVIYNTLSRQTGAGTLYTLPCRDIGRVQLMIENGTFPYTVTVVNNSTGDTLRTETFDSRTYGGNDRGQYNYKDYYSIENMPGGNWGFYVVDGCGYGLPRVDQKVEVKEFPYPIMQSIIASSGNFADSNVIHYVIGYSNNDRFTQQELFHEYVQYRFVYDDLGAGEWKYLPLEEGSPVFYQLYDTISVVNRYCDLWDKTLQFEYKVENCGSIDLKRNVVLRKPNELYFDKSINAATDSITTGPNGCVENLYWHQDNYSIRYFSSKIPPYYDPDYSCSPSGDEYFRYYYTHPITWVYTDVPSGEVIKRDTVANIAAKSRLFVGEVNQFYGASDTGHVILVERKLLDSKGCLLFISTDTMDFSNHNSLTCVKWDIMSSHDPNDHCCNSPRYVRVFSNNSLAYNQDSTIVRLVRSPYNNLYNFEAIYLKPEKRWEIRKDSLGNSAGIFGSIEGYDLYISDYCLPSGTYEFEITSRCGDFHLTKEVSFPNRYEIRTENFGTPTLTRDCSNFTLRYDSGSFRRIIYNTSPESGLPLDPVVENRVFQVEMLESPDIKFIGKRYKGALPINITLSMPGTYIFRAGPQDYDEYCETEAIRFDTVVIDNATVEFVDARAILCDTASTTGTVWVTSTNGTQPYTFTLFDQPNKAGNILGINHTGLFLDVPMTSGQTLSCLVEDSCNAYFHINLQPTTITNMQKVWFDGQMNAITACEGTIIQAHALSLDNIIQYEWTGPDNFHSTTPDPYILVPYGHTNGWYKVTLRQTGCAEELSDSIFLTILEAPDVSLSSDTTVCPGETFSVRFTPQSPRDSSEINFRIAYENANGMTLRQYNARSGITVADTFSTLSPAKIYPFSIDDGLCDQLPAQTDTLHIQLRTDLTQNCGIITTNDTVCQGGNAHLTAQATLSPPYTLSWYGDYYLQHLLKSEMLTENGQWSVYDTAGIMGKTNLYISLQQGEACPSVNGIITSTMNMNDGATTLSCGQHIRVKDSNIADTLAALGEDLIHRFNTTDTTRISITFDRLNLNSTTHLQIFTGNEPVRDSLLGDLNSGSRTMQHFVSNSNALTLRFFGQDTRHSDWSAIVESTPGIATAEVGKGKTTFLKDEVCQSQHHTYSDPLNISPELASSQELNEAIRKAGNYYFTKTYPANDGKSCDSIVSFSLSVSLPAISDTTVVTTDQKGISWHDSLYKESGVYTKTSTLPNGCDKLDILTIKVLNVACSNGEICAGDSVPLSVTASLSKGSSQGDDIPRRATIGDILCTDGSLLPADSFLNSEKTPKGVVFHVDSSGIHGLAIALTETNGILAPDILFNLLYTIIYSPDVLLIFEGMENTRNLLLNIEELHLSVNPSETDALNYCYYYNHLTKTADQQPHGWHLPSAGEMNLLFGNYPEVDKSLTKISRHDSSCKRMTSLRYWTSSLYSKEDGYIFYRGKLEFSQNQNIHAIRPAINF